MGGGQLDDPGVQPGASQVQGGTQDQENVTAAGKVDDSSHEDGLSSGDTRYVLSPGSSEVEDMEGV